MLYFNLRNLLVVALFAISFSYDSDATEVMGYDYNDENWDPQPQYSRKTNALSSKNNSPCKKSPPQSPEKKGSNLLPSQSPVARKLLFSKNSNVDEFEKKQNCAQALSLSRQVMMTGSTNSKSNYLCALLDQESNLLIESVLKSMLQEEIDSSTIRNILANRSPFTVFNLSLKSWATERLYHMSLDGKVTKDIDEKSKERLKSILKNVEFSFSEIATMKRFIAIKLMEPTIKEKCTVSEEDMKFLKTYLEYDDVSPCMHISLMMVNSAKEEMKCIPIQKKMENLIPDGCIDYKIKRSENIMKCFNQREIKDLLSRFYLGYLFVISKRARDYISRVPDLNKNYLYPDIYNEAKHLRRTFPDLSEIAQLYFRENYNLNYDFKGKIAVGINGMSSNLLDQKSINHLFSRIFLLNENNYNKNAESFNSFQKVTCFYIDGILSKIHERENEILNGKTIIDDPDNFNFFDETNQELPDDEKTDYEEKNKSDILKIEKLEKKLTLHFIMNSFFGLSLNMPIFEQLCMGHFGLVNEVINYIPGMNARPIDAILSDLDNIIPEIINGNLLDQKYEIDKNFYFPDIYNKSIIPYIGFFGNTTQELQDKVHEVKNKEINELISFRGNLYEEIEFSNSKIPNPIFWHKFWHILEDKLPQMLNGKKFSFSDLSAQPVEEEEHEGSV